tara:strand:+ start:3100 stop:4116 length:1017 start_codon:yes stop_codon:yes gene_type:complete
MKFPILNNYTYLDTARSGLLYDELLSWRKSHDLEFLEGGSQFRVNHEEFLDKVRKEVSYFFKTDNHPVYLTQNFSLGFKSLLNLINLDQTFLLIKNDYPSIINQVQTSGFKHFFVDNSHDLEHQILNGINKYKPNVLVLSIVQYINGTFLDLTFIKKIKKLFPNLLIIADGTQFCGTKEFDFNNSDIDILISSGYKWLLGGYGNGFIILRNNVVNDFLKNKIFLNQILELGHYDTLNFGSLLFSLKKLSDYGLSNIEKSINKLSHYAKKKFIDKGLLDDQTIKRVNHSNIFNLKGDVLLYTKLTENKIICSQRGGGIRISLNFYNKKEEVDYLLSFFK